MQISVACFYNMPSVTIILVQTTFVLETNIIEFKCHHICSLTVIKRNLAQSSSGLFFMSLYIDKENSNLNWNLIDIKEAACFMTIHKYWSKEIIWIRTNHIFPAKMGAFLIKKFQSSILFLIAACCIFFLIL